MRIVWGVLLTLMLWSCGKKKDQAPADPILSYPENNSQCTTGVSIDQTKSTVSFKWEFADRADYYRLTVTNLLTKHHEIFQTEKIVFAVDLLKNTPYAWKLEALSNSSKHIGKSAEWKFYNASEGVTSIVPFPATIVYPNSGAHVWADQEGKVALEWSGADADDDLESFTVFCDTQNPPTNEIATKTSDTQVKALVNQNTIYYWKVLSYDAQGNVSDSGIFQFKVK